MTVSDLYRVIDSIAPFDTQEEYDNSGFLVGDPAQEVSCILMALDVTPAVVDEAVECGAQLIITHHPLLFTPARRLTEEDYEGRLIRRLTAGMSDAELQRIRGILEEAKARLGGKI